MFLNPRYGRLGVMIAVGALPLLSQGQQTSTIKGKVVLKAGTAVAGATVRLTSPSLQLARTTTTDAEGNFISRLVPPGMYTLEVTKPGHQTLVIRQQIAMGTTFEPRLVLAEVGQAVVTVVASSVEMDKTEVKTATNYSLDQVDALPSGRSMESVALLTPGVTTGVGGRMTVRGGMSSGNLFLLDGQNISDNAYNNRGVNVIDDSIEEIQVLTGAVSAEYGNTDGGVVNAITRRGGNEYKGQLRWELSNPAWNAYQPMQDRNKALNNKLNETKTLSLSGYVIKDRLWFAGSFFQTDSVTPGTISAKLPGTDTNSPDGLNAAYGAGTKEIRRQIKLTYAINENHTLIGSFNNSRNDAVNRNYSAGEIASLVKQISTSEFYNLQWLGIWGDRLSTEVKVGKKSQVLSAGADANGKSPMYNYQNGFYYNNGIFNNTDGGDSRGNRTAQGKVTLMWDGAGSHETVVGFDYYNGTSKARNEQSVTGFTFGVKNINLNTRMATGVDVWEWRSGDGEANNYSEAVFVNDKWAVNERFNVSLGVRFDRFRAEREDGSKSAGASGISPRLGMTYDLLGNGAWVTKLSWNRYNSKPLEGIMNAVTMQGNPTEIDHPYIGPAGLQSMAFLSNIANIRSLYDFNKITYYNNPVVSTFLDGNLKAPTVDELQLGVEHAYDFEWLGKGHVKLTAVKKSWKNLFDYRVGNDGQVKNEAGDLVYRKVWENSDLAKREYKGLEFDGRLERGRMSVDLGVTWSELRGNYEGEGGSSPARGEGLKNYTIQDGVRMYDINTTTPYGYLTAHVPLRIRGTLSYLDTNAWGRTTWGLIYRFDSGSRYSKTRVISPAMLNPNLSEQFGTSSTQYLGERGAYHFDSSAFLDLAVSHEFELFKVKARPVNAMLKLNIGNVLNHQQRLTWDTAYADASTGLTDAWVPASTGFGKPGSNSDYGYARTISASAAIRF